MNKSLILVMCDVLVLSAMSLSSGGFGDGGGAGVLDVTHEYTNLQGRVGILQSELKAVKAERDKKENARLLASEELNVAIEELNRLQATHKNLVGEYDTATGKVGLLDAKLTDANLALKSVEAERDKVKVERDKVRAERDQQENARRLTAEELSDLQVTHANLIGRYDTTTGQVVYLDAALTTANEALKLIKAESDKVRDERDQIKAERDKIQTERDKIKAERDKFLAQRDKVLAQRDRVMDQRDKAIGIVRHLDSALTNANREIVRIQGNVGALKEQLRVVTPDASELRRRKDNIAKSRNCSVRVTVNKGGGYEEKYWSPLVAIDGNCYVLGIYGQKDLKLKVKRVQARIGTNEVEAVSAQYIQWNDKPNLVVFKLAGTFADKAVQFASVGYRQGNAKRIIIKKDAEDQDNPVQDASLNSKVEHFYELGSIWDENKPLSKGDCLVDEEEACIVRMRVSLTGDYLNFGGREVQIWPGYEKKLTTSKGE